MGLTLIQMDLNIQDFGRMINNMVLELKYGLMVLVMRDSMRMEERMVLEYLDGQMDPITKVN